MIQNTDLTHLTWTQIIGWTLGATGWVVGIVAAIVQFKSFANQKKLEKSYENILEQAKRDWEGKYTEEQIRDLAERLAGLQKQIERDIPKQARRVFVKDQIETISDNMAELYARRIKLTAELSDRSELPALPADLRNAIETIIEPEYRERRRKQLLIQWLLLTVLTLLFFVNYTFLIDTLALEIPILALSYRLGLLLWFGLILYCTSRLLSWGLHRRIAGWFMTKSIVSLFLLSLSWLFSLFLLMALAVIGDGWYEKYTKWSVWFPRSVGMTVVAIPLSFSFLITSYALSAPLSTFINKTFRRQRHGRDG